MAGLQHSVFGVSEDDVACSADDCVDAVGGVSAALGVDDVGVTFAIDEVRSDGSGDRVRSGTPSSESMSLMLIVLRSAIGDCGLPG